MKESYHWGYNVNYFKASLSTDEKESFVSEICFALPRFLQRKGTSISEGTNIIEYRKTNQRDFFLMLRKQNVYLEDEPFCSVKGEIDSSGSDMRRRYTYEIQMAEESEKTYWIHDRYKITEEVQFLETVNFTKYQTTPYRVSILEIDKDRGTYESSIHVHSSIYHQYQIGNLGVRDLCFQVLEDPTVRLEACKTDIGSIISSLVGKQSYQKKRWIQSHRDSAFIKREESRRV